MSFLEFYSEHYVSFTCILIAVLIVVITFLIFLFKKLSNSKNKLKTPWFEIAPDSVNAQETEEMGKTRLLLKRQMEFVDNYMKGLQPVFLTLIKMLIDDAMSKLFDTKVPPKTHMISCLIQSETNTLLEIQKSYINNLLVMNHIGTSKEKIENYARGHVSQLIGITRQFCCECYNKLSGDICVDTLKYWKDMEINPQEWTYERLYEVLIGISELRYSDFNKDDSKIDSK